MRACTGSGGTASAAGSGGLPAYAFFRIFPVMKTMHCRISGLVQGVGFRYFVLQRARSLEVRGFVRNAYTGDVEVRAQGTQGALDDFLAELRVGPRSAYVRGLRVDWHEEDEMYNTFEIRV